METNNDCVSEPVRFPLGLDYAPDRAEASQGVKMSEGKKNSDESESCKQIPPLHPLGKTCESAVFRDGRGTAGFERFVVSSFQDSARFGHYSQDL